MQNIEEIIKQLKSIKAPEEYKSASLNLILNQQQRAKNRFSFSFLETLKFGTALGLTGILIIFSLSDTFFGMNARLLSSILLSHLDEQKIENEAKQIDIKITIAEAKYYADSLNKVAMALNETAKDGPEHLNTRLLQKEMPVLDINNTDGNKNIDELLNKLTL